MSKRNFPTWSIHLYHGSIQNFIFSPKLLAFNYENCSLPNTNCSFPTEKTKLPLGMLTHAAWVNSR